jgi:hypothetical protein
MSHSDHFVYGERLSVIGNEPLENNSVMTHPPGGSVPGGARGLYLREDYR